MAHFNPDFLFISGAPHKQHHVQGVGELYWVQAPFLFLGLYFLFKKRHPFKWLVILGILIAFIPVSITNDSIPHALRTLIAVPFYAILTGFGIYETYLFLKNKKKLINAVLLVVFILFVINFVIYLNNLFNLYSKNYSRDWQYGYEQAVEYIEEHSGEYDEIVFSRTYGEPHMFTLFFLNYDPVKYQTNPNLIRYESFDWVWVLKFDKFYFPDLGDKGTTFTDIVARNPDKKLLFIGKPGDFPKEWQRLNKISFLNNNPAFDIVEKK